MVHFARWGPKALNVNAFLLLLVVVLVLVLLGLMGIRGYGFQLPRKLTKRARFGHT